jgi:hypothetical protein
MRHAWIRKGLPKEVVEYQEKKIEEWRTIERETEVFYKVGRPQ